MAMMVTYMRALLGSFVRDERAQDAFEYLLVIGGVSVLVVLAMATPLGGSIIEAVVTGVCNAIKGVVSSVSCTGLFS